MLSRAGAQGWSRILLAALACLGVAASASGEPRHGAHPAAQPPAAPTKPHGSPPAADPAAEPEAAPGGWEKIEPVEDKVKPAEPEPRKPTPRIA